METGLWFKMLLAMLMLGTMASLISGVAVPDLTININVAALLEPSTTCQGFWCAIIDWAIAIINLVWTIFNMIAQGLILFLDSMAFFTGIAALIGTGSFTLPAPFNAILLVVVVFGWIFLAVEVAARFLSALKGGG